MTLEQTIQRMFNKTPMLFRNRDECLNHLFCVIGNEYEWINGQLVDVCSDDSNDSIELKGGDIAKQTIFDPMYDKWRESCPFEWYEAHEGYSYIYVYPKDIQPDWLKGIEETRKKLGI